GRRAPWGRAGLTVDWPDHAVGTANGARTEGHRAMQARYEELSLDTQGDGEILDLTADAQKALANAGFRDGLCTVFVAHSTCGMTMIECEPGCNADLNRVLEQLAPQDAAWRHNELNADSNGHSHVRAALIGPS